MSFPVVMECVPNFSEGRRPQVIDWLTTALQQHAVYVLDASSDADHHRSVITFVGEPDAVCDAMFEVARIAVENIDLDQHTGQHPRIGAVDVVPFIPLRGCTLESCVAMAHRFGQRAGDELNIPVYLYEAAATRPARRNLADVRRPRYEGLREMIGHDPAYTPDYGPAVLGRAGAMAVGARLPLIAFNVYLRGTTVEMAQQIALTIRESGGGLPCVKALGLWVNGQPQVSMNLTDYRVTGLADVIRAIEHEAGLRGTTISYTELIGLIPLAALPVGDLAALHLDPILVTRTLEHRFSVITGDQRPFSFTE